MRGNTIVKWFMPKEERFHVLMDRDTSLLQRVVKVFSEIAGTTDFEDRKTKVAQLGALEKEGDKITAEIFEALNSTFITPFDRDDIRSIAHDLDEIVDFMEEVGQFLIVFELKESPESLKGFARILTDMVSAIHEATSMIWDLANEKKIQVLIVRLSQLENEADALYFRVIGGLFHEDGRHAVEILKWKQIYDGLENACDACKDYGHILGNVVVKNV